VGFDPVVVAGVGSEVADSGLAGRPAFVGAQVGDGVIDIDGAADCGGVGEDVGGIAQQDLFAEAGWDFVCVDGGVAGSEVDHRFHTDAAMVADDQVQLAQ
jgi:hypothetical protein